MDTKAYKIPGSESFGVNKRREVERLVFEIAKREGLTTGEVVESLRIGPNTLSFASLKSRLIRRRFPELSRRGIEVRESFPALELNADNAVDLAAARTISPLHIFVETAAAGSPMVNRLRGLFPSSHWQEISSYRDISGQGGRTIRDYNRRLDSFYLVKENFDFFKQCPCSPGVAACGYHNVNLGFGCPFDCSYCFLQNYTNAPGIVFPVNLNDFFDHFASYSKCVRVGSGETTDSLAFDHLTNYAPEIVEFFRKHPESTFEFKTKSDNVAGLLSVKSSSNVVVGWSVNPQLFIDQEEHFTASLQSRLAAAAAAAAAGYRTSFHFDPIVRMDGWQAAYAGVIEKIFQMVPAESIAWISLGMLRMTPQQKKVIENRFPGNRILDQELVTGRDGKIRYHEDLRREVYRFMMDQLYLKVDPHTWVYLCMEPASMWKDIGVRPPQTKRENL